MDRDLTPKQERFCREYIKDHNATAAAARAGYSKKTAHVQGPRLLDKVRGRIMELDEKIAKKAEVTAEEAINMWREIWEVNSKKYDKTDKDGAIIGVGMIDSAAAAKAAEAIAKMAGVYEKDNRQKAPTSLKVVWGDEDD